MIHLKMVILITILEFYHLQGFNFIRLRLAFIKNYFYYFENLKIGSNLQVFKYSSSME